MPLPHSMPLIVLAECNVLPHALLPLNIFEPRYREMLAHALTHDRFLCIGTAKTAGPGFDAEDDNIEPYSCAGLVRACVGQSDGTSRLILQGVRRIRFQTWIQREPFRVASIQSVDSIVKELSTAHELAQEVLAAARAKVLDSSPFSAEFDKQFGALTDPEVIADVIGYNFLPRASDRQPLLGMSLVEDRLAYLQEKLASTQTPDWS